MAWTDDPISDSQVWRIRKEVSERDISSLPQAQIDFVFPRKDDGSIDEEKQEFNLRRMTKGQASEAITLLTQLPMKPQTPVVVVQTGAATPAQTTQTKYQPYTLALGNESREGHFFIVDPTDGKEKFFHVNYGKEGSRWEGHVFLQVRASDDLYPVKDLEHRAAIFAEINKDPITAMNKYGIELGECGVCGRTLTDRDSRLRGIGPICAAKLGPTEEQSSILRTLGLIKDE
jgi:hypothetical protein